MRVSRAICSSSDGAPTISRDAARGAKKNAPRTRAFTMDLALPLYHTILRAAAHCTTPRSNARRFHIPHLAEIR